jgi:hypothetical protein
MFTLGRDAGPGMLHRTSRRTGAPVGALIWVGAGSLLTLLVVIKEPLATRAVTIGLTYGADLIIAAYLLVVVAAIIFTVRRRMSPVTTVILLVGLAVLGYVVKATFVPIPPAPYHWDALAAGITLAAGIALPFVYRPLWRGIQHSPLLRVGASALLGPGRDREPVRSRGLPLLGRCPPASRTQCSGTEPRNALRGVPGSE